MAFQVLHEWCGSNFCWFDSSMVSLFTNHCKMGSQFLRFATNYYLLFCIFKLNSLKFAANCKGYNFNSGFIDGSMECDRVSDESHCSLHSISGQSQGPR